jgi:hemolysin activation/secretion protein
MQHEIRGIATLLLAVLLPALAQAQIYERVAPQTPQPGPSPAIVPPPAAPPPAASQQVVLPALKGLVFVPGMAALRPAGLASAGTPSVSTEGLPLLADPDFRRQVTPFLGRPTSIADLQRIAAIASDWYRGHGRPFVMVDIPPQNISGGVVQVVVAEYRLGQVAVTGNRWFSSDMLRRESGLHPGQTLTLPGLQADLAWLNANPFRTVTAMFAPGAQPAQTDVTLQTRDRLPVYVHAGFDNAGVANLGRNEWNVGSTWGNAFNSDQILSYQFTRGVTGRFEAHAMSWMVPLPWRDKLLVFGSYEQERPDVGTDFTEIGHGGQASLRYVHTLPELRWLQQDVELGYDFKTSNSNEAFGGTQVYASNVEVDQFLLIYEGTQRDAYGEASFDNQLVLSPGGITGANTTSAFQMAVPGSTANYVYDRIGISRLTHLPAGFSWIARVIGQVANGNLPYSEQLAAGGPDSVRGYTTDTALGSQGVLLSQEILAPAMSLSHLLGAAGPLVDQLQPGVFWDYGQVAQVRTIPGQVNEADLASVGLGLHATLDRYADLTLDVGWALRDAPGMRAHSAIGDIAVSIGF